MSKRDLLLEIGMEEVPARFLPGFVAGLREALTGALRAARLEHGPVKGYGAPRRVAVLAQGVDERQADREVETRGPSAAAAYDAEGRPTRAAGGFARGQGVPVEELARRGTPAGEYVFARRTEHGRLTAELLPAMVSDMLYGLQFPRQMRWGDCDFLFVRPIRWLLCMLGSEPVRVALSGLPADLDDPPGHSRGHRFLAPGLVRVTDARGYSEALRKASVIVDPAEREKLISDGAAALAAGAKGTIDLLPDLLEELVWLAEHPYPVLGSFAESHLELPEAILTTSMRYHQRFFPVRRGAGGELAAAFVAVRDGGGEHLDVVRRGYERVLAARLADAEFFFREDRKRSLAAGAAELTGVTYHERLGSMADKTRRLRHLGVWLAVQLGLSADQAGQVDRAAELAKCDLVTRVVREFPVLQGIIGGEYARLDREDEAVAAAIASQYLPADEAAGHAGGAGGRNGAGSAKVALALAVADRADSLVGHAFAGVRPTGSEDPYGMRRAASGVVAWLRANGCHVRLDELADAAGRAYREVNGFDGEALQTAAGEVLQLLTFRLEALLGEEGCAYDEIAATAASTGLALVPGLWSSACGALGQARRQAWFADVVAGGVRAAGLGAGALAGLTGPARPEGFVAPEEGELHRACQAAAPELTQHLESGRFIDYWRRLLELKEPLDRFLDRVLVMAPEEDLRRNRLALCGTAHDLYARAGDLSKLVTAPAGTAEETRGAR